MSVETKSELKWSEMTISEKGRHIVQNITVEPLFACYIFPGTLAMLATQNLYLEKACRVNLNYSDDVCTALEKRLTDNFTHEEEEVQQLVAGMSVWRTFLQSLIPFLLIMFVGSWSDRKGKRKPFMLIPVVGELLNCIGLMLCVYFFDELPMEVAGFIDAFIPYIAGGWMTMYMAIFSYVGDITTVEMRTLRIGIVNVIASVGSPVGTALSGVLFKTVGFYGVYSISSIMYISGITYGLFMIKEVKRVDVNKDVIEKKVLPRKDIENDWTITRFLKEFFDFQHIRDTFSVIFKAGDNVQMKRFVFLMIILMLITGPEHGELSVMYLFMRFRFNWDELQFSIFSTYSLIANLIGTSISVGVFSHVLKIDDALIGVMSCTSKILASLIYAFAQTEWQVYFAPLVDIVNGTSYIAMRSIASKMVPPEELGKLNSLFGACEAFTPMLFGPIYSFVYGHTMNTMPGAFFIMGIIITLPANAIFLWMYKQHKGDKTLLQTSRKSSLAEDVLKSLRVDPLAVTPIIPDPPTHQEIEMKEKQSNKSVAGRDK